MPVRVERRDRVLTVIHSRPEARNAVDPTHAQALYEAFIAFDGDEAADVAVFWGEGGAFCAGADLKSLAIRGIATRDNAKTHAARPDGSVAAHARQAGHRRDRGTGGRRRHGACALGRLPRYGRRCLYGRL